MLVGIFLCYGSFTDIHEYSPSNNTLTITDSSGRQLSIPYPVTKAAVANAYNTEIINALGALDKVVGIDYNIYQDQTGFHKQFSKNQVIGNNQRELNYEKIIELNPQILILTENGSVDDAHKKLGAFGISVVVVNTYYTDEFAQNCFLLGKIFGKEKEAEDLVAFFQDKLVYLKKSLANVKKKTVYFEYRQEGNTTIPGDYFYKMIEYAGGANIFSDAINVNVDAEAIIGRNPQYIIKVANKNSFSKYEPPALSEHEAIYQEIKNRPGWDTIDAVKNNNILLMSHYVHGGASKLVGSMYVAKFIYPEHLPELEPENIFREWLEKYQHLPYISGHTYPAYKLKDE